MTVINETIFQPENWEGYNILDPNQFVNVEHKPAQRLRKKEYNAARDSLAIGIGQIAAGNMTEIKYGIGKEFDTDLPDGSIVITDNEAVMIWRYNEPGNRVDDQSQTTGRRLVRPYSSHWLRAQYDNTQPKDVGVESLSASGADKKLLYVRTLHWGVLTTQDGHHGILEFGFGAVKLLNENSVSIPTWYGGLHDVATPLPVSVGFVEPDRLELETCTIDSLSRVRSVDIVYPAKSSTPKSRKRFAPKLARLVPSLYPL